jgi:hypothetical protein
MKLVRLLPLLALACSSGTVVDVEPVPADYTDWYRIDVTGEVPGHGDTYRIIYANDDARLFGQTIVVDRPSGPSLLHYDDYPNGSIIVKEIHERDGDQPGDLKYIGVMRMLGSGDTPSGADLKSLSGTGGWLFTYLADGIDSDEEYRSSCWDECHVSSPYGGPFYNYGE